MNGLPQDFKVPEMYVQRILDRIEFDPNGGCWLWPGATYGQTHVYGKIGVPSPSRTLSTHRLLYVNLIGDLPGDLTLDHKCRVTLCCNPAHLEPVTRQENLERSPTYLGHRTGCPAGHAYDAENTYFTPRGTRGCKTCRREQLRAWKEKPGNRARLYEKHKEWRARQRASA